jgi:hypothetical protein
VTPSWIQPDRDRSRDAIEKAFEFQSQLLEARKSFALDLLDAASPDAVKAEKPTSTIAKK